MTDKKQLIDILVKEDAVSSSTRAFGDSVVAKSIDADVLVASIAKFVSAVDPIAAKIKSTAAGFVLEEIVFNLDVSAEGTVSILGTGVSTTFGGGISIHLKARGADEHKA